METNSAPQLNNYQHHTNSAEKKVDNKVKCQVVPSVFGPVLKTLQLFGFPVPDDCIHLDAESERDCNTCTSSCNSEDNPDLLDRKDCGTTLLVDATTLPGNPEVKRNVSSCDPTERPLQESLSERKSNETPNNSSVYIVNYNGCISNDHAQKNPPEMNGDSQPMRQKKRRELDRRQQVAPSAQPHEKDEPVWEDSTTKPTTANDFYDDNDSGSTHTNQERNTKKTLCPKCQRKKTLIKCIFAFNVIFLVGNLVRFVSVFFTETYGESGLVSSMVKLIFWTWSACVYVASYHALCTHLPHLLHLLQLYDNTYSIRADCRALRKNVIVALSCCGFFQTVLILCTMVGIHTFLPSFKVLLSPFQNTEGAVAYVMTALLGLISAQTMGPFTALSLLFYLGTYLLVTEYQHVTRQLSLLLTSREDSLLEETQPAGNHRRSEQEQPVSGSHDVNTGDHSNIDRNGQISNDDFQTMTQHPMGNRRPEQEQPESGSHGASTGHHSNITKPAETSGKATSPEFNPKINPSLKHLRTDSNKDFVSDTNFIHSKTSSQKKENENLKKRPQVIRVAANSTDSPPPPFVYHPPSQSFIQTKSKDIAKNVHLLNNTEKHRASPVKQRVTDDAVLLEDIEETFPSTDDSDGNPSTPQTDEEHQLRVRTEACHPQPPEHQARDRLPHRGHTRHSSRRVQGRRHGHEGRSEEGEVEEVFDQLCGQHQVLCAILHRFQGCLAHVISIAFICDVPVFCMLIYGLGSSSIRPDELGMMAVTLVHAFLILFTNITLGILVNDHAHSVQEVIFAADWSQFSDRLLTKVQLFMSRFSHTKIGYHVYGLFVIDRSTVLMVLGTLATYTVVVIQFQQTSVPMCHRDNNTTALSGTPSH